MGHPRNVILHYHIFKNAGSTLCSTLERNFGNDFAQLHSPRHDQRLSGEDLLQFVLAQPGVQAVSSHHLSPPAPTSDKICVFDILILREPLDRIRSMYDFYRRSTVNADPLTVDAKRLSLPRFLEYVLETRPFLLINSQTNVVANAGRKIPDADDLNRAAAIVKATSVVGIVEEYDICALQAERVLKPVFPQIDLSYFRENVTPSRGRDLNSRLDHFRAACGERLFAKLVESNLLDKELSLAARNEAVRRWREMSRCQAELRSFQRRVHQRTISHAVTHQLDRVRRFCGRAVAQLSPQQ